MKKILEMINLKWIEDKFKSIPVKKETLAKVLSLVLSISLWAYISSTNMGEIRFKLPVEIKNLPASMTIADMPDKSVIVILEGKKEYMKNVSSKNVRVFVNLENPKQGETRNYPLQYTRIDLPEGVNISFDKPEISVTVEKIFEKKVKVIPKISGILKSGNIIGRITVTPEYVTVRGARPVVKELNYIFTEDISIEDEAGEIVKDVELSRDNLKDMTVSESTIKVVIPIINYGDLYSLDVPVIVKNIDKNYKYLLEIPTVKVYMKSSDKRGILPGDIDASIDVGVIPLKTPEGADRKTASKELPVSVTIIKNAENSEVVSVSPEKLTVKIEKK